MLISFIQVPILRRCYRIAKGHWIYHLLIIHSILQVSAKVVDSR